MKRKPPFLYIIFFSLMVGMAFVHAAGEENNMNAAQAVTWVVRAQLDAFANDDAEKAFSLTTSSTQNLAGTPNDFLQVIKRQFTPIYRHRDAIFSEPEIIGEHALQIVELIDHDNFIWIAIYQVEREADGAWKVDGCQLFETNKVSI